MIEQKKYYPQLDAIRGISVLSVFTYHAFKPVLGFSFIERFTTFVLSHLGMGLDVFFILSSFLLTLLGIKEYEKYGKFSIKNYFIRRAFRIWPLYFVLMFVSFVVLPIIKSYTGQQLTLPPASWYLLFVSNFYMKDHVFFLRLLWTLSVEEQFYLLWGICLFFFQKNLKFVIFFFALVSIFFNIWAAFYDKPVYFHTLTYIVDMMVGAYAAYSLKKQNWFVRRVLSFNKIWSFLFYYFLPILFLFYFLIDQNAGVLVSSFLYVVVRFIFIIYIAVLIIDQMINTTGTFNLSNQKFLIYTGKISYGLYCFHGFVISFVTYFLNKVITTHPAIMFFILLGGTYLCASISYVIIEKPFLRLKDKLQTV